MSKTHRKTELVDARVTPRFAGVATFCRFPRLEEVRGENRPVDWAVFGVPFDGGVTYRPGARFGPRAIREESQYIKRYSIEHGVDICERLSLADAGDSPVSPYSCEENAEKVFEFVKGLPDPGVTRPMAIGGDHSIAYANIKGAYVRAGSPNGGLGLIHFDSHLDTVDAVWGERWGHASVFRRVIEEGLVDPKRMVSLGLKGPLNTGKDLEFAASQGVRVLTYEQAVENGVEVLREYAKANADGLTYVTFDVDCVDPAFAPGTGTPSVGGFTSAEAVRFLRACKGVRLAGADVVEVLPDRDVSGITALLAAQVMFEILALDAASR